MTELFGIRRFKPTISHPHSMILTRNDVLSDYSDDELVSTLPMIVNPYSRPYRNHDVFVRPIFEPPPIRYISPSPPPTFRTVIENKPVVYQRIHSPDYIEEHPYACYRSCETPIRRCVQPSDEKKVHLPKHTKKLVNRFLNNLEHAHDHRHTDGNDSDCSLDDCNVCRQLRSAMNDGKRRTVNDGNLYHNSRVVFETQNPSRHCHLNNCKVCNLLEKSDFGISNTKQQGKHVHVIETFPSNNNPTIETTTTTKLNPTGLVPIQPMGYNTFIDPNTGYTYAYDPNWQYDPNSVYIPNNIHTTTGQVIIDTSHPSTMDKATYTRMGSEDKKTKSNDKTIIVHSSRHPTPRTPKVVIERSRTPKVIVERSRTPKVVVERSHRRHRVPRKHRSRTVIEERSIRMPHTKTTNYI